MMTNFFNFQRQLWVQTHSQPPIDASFLDANEAGLLVQARVRVRLKQNEGEETERHVMCFFPWSEIVCLGEIPEEFLSEALV